MVVLIEGSQEQTEAARSQIEDILKQYRNQATYPKENLPLNRPERTVLLAEAGKAISHIRQSSGARLYIQDIPENDEEWTLTISGTPESIQKAKEIVEETINQAKAEYEKRMAAHKKRMAEKKAKKAEKKAKKAEKKAKREAEKGMTEQERRQAQSKRDKAKAAAKKDAATE